MDDVKNAVCCIYCDEIHAVTTYHFWKVEECINYYFCPELKEPIYLERAEVWQRKVIAAYERGEYLR